MAYNTLSNLSPEQQVWVEDLLLSTPTPTLVMNSAAMLTEIPAKNGFTVRYSRYPRLPTAPVPLGPTGAPIPATQASRVDIDATISYFGQFLGVTTQVTTSNQDNVLMEFSKLLGLSLRMTEDQLTKAMFESASSVYRCTGGNNGDIPSNLSLPDLDDVTSALLSNDAWMIFSAQGGEDRQFVLYKFSLIDLEAEVVA